MEKYDKNYFRDILLELMEETDGKPNVIKCKYKERYNKKWILFTSLRPYISGIKTKTICDHIHINRIEAEKYFKFTQEHHNRTFYIICYPWFYNYNGIIRGTVKLAKSFQVNPILFVTEKEFIKRIWAFCYKFNSKWFRDKEWYRLSGFYYDKSIKI